VLKSASCSDDEKSSAENISAAEQEMAKLTRMTPLECLDLEIETSLMQSFHVLCECWHCYLSCRAAE